MAKKLIYSLKQSLDVDVHHIRHLTIYLQDDVNLTAPNQVALNHRYANNGKGKPSATRNCAVASGFAVASDAEGHK